jgi:hypothetical protein
MRKLGILAVAGLSSLVLANAASAAPANCTAPATPVPLAFNNAVVGTPAGSLVAVTPATAPITATACVVPPPASNAGSFTIDPSQFNIPSANFSVMGINGTVQAGLKQGSEAVGQLYPTGQMTLTADLVATLTVPALGGACVADTGPQSYSTETTNLLRGVRFPVVGGMPNFLTGAGAITGGWASLKSQNGPACVVLGAALSSGSLWISRDISPTPTLTATAPASAKVGAGKSVSVTVTVKDTGVAPATKVNVCASAPKALNVQGPKCMMVASIAPGGSANVTFTFKAPAKDRSGTSHVTFNVTSTGATSVAAATSVKVTAKKTKKKRKK